MNLFQYILLPFGLSLRHKTLDYIFSGISSSVFFLMAVTTLLSLPINTSIEVILLKISSFGLLFVWIWAYILLNKRSEDLYGMFDAILVFERNRTPKERLKFGFSLILFISCLMLSYVLSIHFTLSNIEFNLIFAPVQFEILFYHHAPLTFLFLIYWVFVIQFIHFEFCYKYNNLLKFSNTVIERYLSYRPDFVIRYQINEVIENFVENDKQFNKIIKPLKSIICLMILFVNFDIFLTYIVLGEDRNSITSYLIYSITFIINFYTIVTQIITSIKSEIQNTLIDNINNWRQLTDTNIKLISVKKYSKFNPNIC